MRLLIRKGLLGVVGFLVACCVLGIVVSALRPARSPLSSVQIQPNSSSGTPVPVVEETKPGRAVGPPTSVAPDGNRYRPDPTDPLPTTTNTPTAEPTTTLVATLEAVSAPSSDQGPTYANGRVDPEWWPCQQGQIKGNQNSKSRIFHVPGQRDYARTFKSVECFDTEAEAIAAGYRKAKR